MLTPEQVAEIKSQIKEQIQNFPDDKKAAATEKLESMNAEELENFVEQNNLIKSDKQEQQCVFCLISSGKINTHKIGENSNAVAVLEINPISEGHSIIIPKEHENSDETKEISSLTKETEEKIKKLNPKKIIKSNSSLFGHTITNLIPVYKNETLESERQKPSPEELEETLKKLQEEKIKAAMEKIKIDREKLWLPQRIP